MVYLFIVKVSWWFHQLGHVTFSKLQHRLFFKSLFISKLKFHSFFKDGISNMESDTRKYFQQKSCGHPNYVIYRPHSSKVILNLSIQLISCQWIVNFYFWKIKIYRCSDVSNFRHRVLKGFDWIFDKSVKIYFKNFKPFEDMNSQYINYTSMKRKIYAKWNIHTPTQNVDCEDYIREVQLIV